jgi:flagellar biosynthesis repressor protein FlbT
MSLKIDLKAGEKFIVNGAVMVAGKSGASLILQNQATFLRAKDIMQEHEANTPGKRIYFVIMLMYIDPESHDDYYSKFAGLIDDYLANTSLAEVRRALMGILQQVNMKRFYQALKLCKSLIQFETKLLEVAETGAKGGGNERVAEKEKRR